MHSSIRIAFLVVAALTSTVLASFVSKDGNQYCTSLNEKCNICIADCEPAFDNPNYQICIRKFCKGPNKYCTKYQAQSKNAADCMMAKRSVAG
ncbi:BQ5605_C009g05785 [Microbotryum silenes-dioicae]|uniref:BQ5605_C009g05785 protein n=1 Tax=Microbotryum silenes-dioicae TaxID=796604 RepID=A0A2X0P9H7_9BASI|nr:BQ5605_C009g05785 [Microbotryum silenes-dioicae]